jgi:hypothetical protein
MSYTTKQQLEISRREVEGKTNHLEKFNRALHKGGHHSLARQATPEEITTGKNTNRRRDPAESPVLILADCGLAVVLQPFRENR